MSKKDFFKNSWIVLLCLGVTIFVIFDIVFSFNEIQDVKAKDLIVEEKILQVDIGEKINEKGSFNVYYAGMMNDSVLFNIYHDKAEAESVMLFSIPKSRTTKFSLPFFNDYEFTITSINDVTGEIELRINEDM